MTYDCCCVASHKTPPEPSFLLPPSPAPAPSSLPGQDAAWALANIAGGSEECKAALWGHGQQYVTE